MDTQSPSWNEEKVITECCTLPFPGHSVSKVRGSGNRKSIMLVSSKKLQEDEEEEEEEEATF